MMYASTRYATGGFVGITVSLALLYAMQGLIAQAKGLGNGGQRVQFLPFVHVNADEAVHVDDERYAPPPKPSPLPPSPSPKSDPLERTDVPLVLPPPGPGDIDSGPKRFPRADGDALVLVTATPVYPPRPLERGLEGNCVVEYTITVMGTVENPSIVACTSAQFERASLNAARKFRYQPRVVDGVAVPVYGHRNRFVFAIED